MPNIEEGLQKCSTEKLIIQLLKNSLAQSLLVDRILRLNVPDIMKISLIKSATSANGIEHVAGMVSDLEGDDGSGRHWTPLEIINWGSVESALRDAGAGPHDRCQDLAAESHVYFIESETTGLIKIGRSVNPSSRFNAIRTMSPDKLVLLGSVPETVCSEAELHKRFAKHRKHGEWFEASPEIRELIEETLSA